MTESSNDCFEKQQQQEQRGNLGNPTFAAAPTEPTTATEATATPKTCIKNSPPGAHPVTPAEYIYNTMIPPPSKSPPSTVERPVALGKRERCNTGGSSVPPGPVLSMDLFLNTEDLQVDIGDLGGMLAYNSEDVGLKSLQSADIVQSMLLPDVATTAAVALRGSAPPPQPLPQSAGSGDFTMLPPIRRQESADEDDELCPMANLTGMMERISTADEIAPLNEKFRISSKDWMKDMDDSDPGPMHPSLFMGNNGIRNPSPAPALPSANGCPEYQIPLEGSSSDWFRVAKQFSTSLPLDGPPPPANPSCPQAPPVPVPPLSNPNVASNPAVASPTLSAAKGGASPTSSMNSKRKKKKKKRQIDESRAVEPTDDDVLFGRGGFTNTHPGNIRFRAKALELRPWYEQPTTTKEEKYQISDMLVESVRGYGHRFLERGEDGLWHEVIGNGARKKASQALRERVKGRRSGGSTGKLSSSGTTGGKDDGKDLASSGTGDVVGV